MRIVLAVLLFAIAGLAAAAGVDPALIAKARRDGAVDVLIVPRAGTVLDAKRLPLERKARLHAAHAALGANAARAQHGIARALRDAAIEYRAFAIANAVHAKLTPAMLRTIAARADVAAIVANTAFRADLPKPEPASAKAPTFNLTAAGATALWAQGVRGEGIVVAGQDTGYQWDHPALREAYRGYSAAGTSHAYAWHDSIHAQVNPTDSQNACGYDSPAPCDDDGHGTHTMGIVVGDDGGANQTGMAPDARWIGCRNMDQGWGSPATYLECLDWFLAPTNADGLAPNPSMAPHVINNSWGCPAYEGCDEAQSALLAEAVRNLRAAGILFVASAGNGGSGCGTVIDAPAGFDAAFAIGAASDNGSIASFSSRGPTPEGLLKPDITAPGVSIRSSVPTSTYANLSGTSMASPHVAGAAALILSAAPHLIGRPDELERVLRGGASPRMQAGQDCGGYSGAAVPNAVHGHGFLDTVAAVEFARAILFSHSFE